MATATKTSDFYTDTVHLTLNDDEAQTLMAILAFVGGSPDKSPRKHQASMSGALRSVGYRYDDASNKAYPLAENTGVLFFNNYPERFVPGYYKDSGDGEVRHFSEEPINELARGEWQRVNVELA